MDNIALVDKYPASDERVQAEKIVRSIGGPAAVTAITLARQGIKAAIIGTIGKDQDGDAIIEIFKKEGVDTSGISSSEEPTSGSVIVVSKSEKTRAISTRQPISQIAPSIKAKEILKSARWIHVDHVGISQLESLEIKRGDGPLISFDAGYGVKDFDVKKVDLFAPNHVQMKDRHPDMSTEKATEADSIAGENLVVTTIGTLGSVGFSKESGLVKADSIKGEILSTLGAGDVFHGAILAALFKGEPLASALKIANIVAGLSCRGLDGTSAIPSSAELQTYLENGLK